MSFRYWDPANDPGDNEYRRIIDLHRENKATLGQLPYTAFNEAGYRRRILLGFLDDQISGYVLYGTPYHHPIKLVHVCVGKQARGTGLARSMVEHIIEQHPERTSVIAYCRTDYGLDKFWASVGMTKVDTKPGRAIKGSTLDVWARKIGELDLFEQALYSSTNPLAVLDSNVVIDIFSSENFSRPQREESLPLMADWAVDLVNFGISPEVMNELGNIPETEREIIQDNLASFQTIRRSSKLSSLSAELKKRIPIARLASDSSLENDLKHLADAILNQADYFVTRDDKFIEVVQEWCLADYGIRVLRPSDLLQAILPESLRVSLQSELLESLGLELVEVREFQSDMAEPFINTAMQESMRQLKGITRTVLARPSEANLRVIKDSGDRRWALFGTELTHNTLNIPLLRVAPGQLATKILFQLIRFLRDYALANNADSICVTDSNLPEAVRNALIEDGFESDTLRTRISLQPDILLAESLTSRKEVVNYERSNWPQVVLKSQLPTWIIPIQPQFARELIGYNDTLMLARQKQSLGLSRNLAYFAKPRISLWDVPGRILWYVTKDTGAREATAVRAIVAYSRIVDCTIMNTEDAIEAFQRYGTLNKKKIQEQSNKGQVLVLHFEDTKLLDKPLSRMRLGPLFSRHDVKTPIQTARAVSPTLFDDIIKAQHESEI